MPPVRALRCHVQVVASTRVRMRPLGADAWYEVETTYENTLAIVVHPASTVWDAVPITGLLWEFTYRKPKKRKRGKPKPELPTKKGFSVDTLMVLEDLKDDIEVSVRNGKMNRATKQTLQSALERLAVVLAAEQTKPKPRRAPRPRREVAFVEYEPTRAAEATAGGWIDARSPITSWSQSNATEIAQAREAISNAYAQIQGR